MWKNFAILESESIHPTQIAAAFRSVSREAFKSPKCEYDEVLEINFAYWNFTIKHLKEDPTDSSLVKHAKLALKRLPKRLGKLYQRKLDKILSISTPVDLNGEEE